MSFSEVLTQSEHGLGPLVEDKAAKSIRFTSTLMGIQSRPIIPENIDSYAGDALSDLINLTVSVTEEYRNENLLIAESGKELEDKAFAYFGLNNIDEILSHVATKDSEIKHIADLIGKAENIGITIVPPQEQEYPIQVGSGNYEKKSIISRTKTLLFILSNDFDVNLDDPEQVTIKTGVLSDSQMRGLSYFMINVPGLNRTVLCCDEEGNVTYVFDNSVLDSHGISPEDLSRLTKADINDLLQADPEMGKRVIYSPKFVPGMIGLMTDLQANASADDLRGFYLYPKAPEEVLSAKSFALELGVARETVVRAISELGDRLGEIQNYRFNTMVAAGFSPEQLELIRKHLEGNGNLSAQPPEHVLSAVGFANELGIDASTIRRAVNELGDSLGEAKKYKFGGNVTVGYSSEQQQLLRQHLESRGLFSAKPPDGFITNKDLSKQLAVDSSVVQRAVEKLAEQLGPVNSYRFNNSATARYSPEQQETIREYLEERGNFAGQASEGVLSGSALSKQLGVASSTLNRAIEMLRDSLDGVKKYRFSQRIVAGYTPKQQEMIRKYLRENGFLGEAAPDGIMSSSSIARQLGVSIQSVDKSVEELGVVLGRVGNYRFNSTLGAGFTIAQQEMIKRHLQEKNLFVGNAPEGVLSARKIAEKLGIDPEVLRREIKTLDTILGEVRFFRFYVRIVAGYTPEQQNMIREYLDSRGLLARASK